MDDDRDGFGGTRPGRPARSHRGRRIAGVAIALLVLVAGCGLMVRDAGHDAARWHVDLATTERSSRPNDFFAAPSGTTAAEPDLSVTAEDPAAALAAFDRVARAAPRVQVVAGSVGEGRVTYIQRSALIGFPDYVTAQVVEGGLAVWSRSRYGYSDLGVNEARVRRWLGEAGLS